MIKGFWSKTKENRVTLEPVTVQKIGKYRVGVETYAQIAWEAIVSDATEAGSTDILITAVAHVAREGDKIRITSGALLRDEAIVFSTTANTITLAQKLSASLGAGVSFTVYRPSLIVTDSAGNVLISGTVAISGGTVDANIISPVYAQNDSVGNGFLVGGTDSGGTAFIRFMTAKLAGDGISAGFDYFICASVALALDTTTGSDFYRLRGSIANGLEVDIKRMPTVTTLPTKSPTATLSNVSASASSVTLLSANANRLGATITNDSTADLYVKFGTTASATSFTVILDGVAGVAKSYYEVPYNYTGRIDGIWASATGAARVTELT